MANHDPSMNYGPPQTLSGSATPTGENGFFFNGNFASHPAPNNHNQMMGSPHVMAPQMRSEMRPGMALSQQQGSAGAPKSHSLARKAQTVPSAHHNNTPVSVARNAPKPNGNMPQGFSQQHLIQQQQLRMLQQQQRMQAGNAQGPSQISPQAQNQHKSPQNRQNAPGPSAPKSGPSGQHTQQQNSQLTAANQASNGPRRHSSSAGPQARPAEANGPNHIGPAANTQQESLNARAMRKNAGNAAIMRVLDMVESVSSAPQEMITNLGFWARVCEAFFKSASVMRITGPERDPQASNGPNGAFFTHSATNSYQLNVSTAPRFLLAQVQAHNVGKHDIFLTGFRYQMLAGGYMVLVCRLNVTFHYKDGSTGTALGTCRFLMTKDLFIQHLDCRVFTFRKQVSMDFLQRQWTSFTESKQGDNVHGNQDFYRHVSQDAECSKAEGNAGLSVNALRLMQIGDIMSCLHPLMQFTKASNISSPLMALETFVQNASRQQEANTENASHSGEAMSPSPKTVTAGEPKAVKKRKMSSSFNSPRPDTRKV
ncbi:hypothetical protein OXX80_000526 [Metschnikowia pulcherrima]